jgi:hypothetical protein
MPYPVPDGTLMKFKTSSARGRRRGNRVRLGVVTNRLEIVESMSRMDPALSEKRIREDEDRGRTRRVCPLNIIRRFYGR